MPCATVHMALAGRVLDRWETHPASSPVPLAREGIRDAFLNGAMGPDLGFVPGTDRLVSEAAHYLQPGDLARNLLGLARSWREEAFAWGWAAHLLTDVEIHPVVGRAVGERLFGDRNRRVDALADVTSHVSLEVGLDVTILRGTPGVPAPPARSFFPGSGRTRWLVEALSETYGLEWDPGLLVRHHIQAVRLTRWWPRALSLLPLRPAAEPGSGPVAGVGRRRGATNGFLAPEAPRPWFLREVKDRIEALVEGFQEAVESGLADLGNPNLETGEASGVGLGHPATDQAARRLERIRARGGGRPAPG
jgi:hypothetical protein